MSDYGVSTGKSLASQILCIPTLPHGAPAAGPNTGRHIVPKTRCKGAHGDTEKSSGLPVNPATSASFTRPASTRDAILPEMRSAPGLGDINPTTAPLYTELY
ncbi:hypothetical protein BD309DRAFT_380649 [Dichomitus squalens]|nr:hypothetical protein BD309DRAFT_380649 [Dichomitus squalens]